MTLNSVANLVWLALEYSGTEGEIAEDIEDVIGRNCRDEVLDTLGKLNAIGAVSSSFLAN